MARKAAKAAQASPHDRQEHWLVRTDTIRKLWIVSIIVLALTVLVEPLFEGHGYFGIDDLWGFNAIYGFAACVAMVAVAKALGALLKRPDDYYEE